jgi:hypothetical protein
MAEITIESFLCKVRFGKYFYLGVCSTLFITLTIVVLIYYTLIIGNTKVSIFSNLTNVLKFQVFIMGFSSIFCIFIKASLFFEEDKMSTLCQSMLQ